MNLRVNPLPYVPTPGPRISSVTRTINPRRPDWLDDIKRPLRIVAYSKEQFDLFVFCWDFCAKEVAHITMATQVSQISLAYPLLVLPDASKGIMEGDWLDPIAAWEQRGGLIINIPLCAFRNIQKDIKVVRYHFPEDFNFIASSIVHAAKHRQLDWTP